MMVATGPKFKEMPVKVEEKVVVVQKPVVEERKVASVDEGRRSKEGVGTV